MNVVYESSLSEGWEDRERRVRQFEVEPFGRVTLPLRDRPGRGSTSICSDRTRGLHRVAPAQRFAMALREAERERQRWISWTRARQVWELGPAREPERGQVSQPERAQEPERAPEVLHRNS